MKACVTELSGRITTYNTNRKVSLLAFTLILFMIIYLLINNCQSPFLFPNFKASDVTGITLEKKCDVFSGKWVPHPEGPNYTNESCHLMIDQQNCVKLGRPDKEYMDWRWKPDECELPVFNPAQFFELVRGKSMAFVGDSVGRNQMQSLLCLLSSVAYPEDLSHKYSTNTDYFRRYFYADYKFTVATFWSPFLVKSSDADPKGHSLDSLMNIYLDKADEAWVNEVENFDYVIVSAGQWFFRPLIYKENNQIIGCYKCYIKNITAITNYYGYRMAFRTAFRTLQSLKNYKGITFLRTFSPSHFENGDWDKGGNCPRTRPFTSEEMKLEGFALEFYLTQVEELRAAEREGTNKGLKFRLLDTTEIMLLRPDGHPNQYGQSPHKHVAVNDCVHWCLPGPIDAWNEFLLYMMKIEGQRLFQGKI